MRYVILSFFFFITGCGGGANSPDGDVVEPTFSERLTAFDAIFLDTTDDFFTPEPQIPVTGSVRYVGEMRLNLPTGPNQSQESYLSLMRLNVDFADSADPISGGVSELTGNQSELSGELRFSEGAIDGSVDPQDDFMFFARMGGTLRKDGNAHVVDGQILGDFYGADAAAVAGRGFGTVSSDAGADLFDGTFAGTRP